MRLFARRDMQIDTVSLEKQPRLRLLTREDENALEYLGSSTAFATVTPATVTAAFTEEQRMNLAKNGEAMPDGSFPIRNRSDLKNAIGLAGRADDPVKARAWIMKRARELHAEDMLPDDWKTVTADCGHCRFVVAADPGGFSVIDSVNGDTVGMATDAAGAVAIADAKNEAIEYPVDEPDADVDDLMSSATQVDVGKIATLEAVAEPDPEMEAIVAAIPVNPPADWFFMDEPDEPTPMTVTEEGLVFGHAAIWGTCHLGNPRGAGVCVQPPASQTDYALFHLGELQADGGDKVPVGQITLDTGHAPMGASARTAAAHYDDTGAVVADVRAKNGVHGIFYSGALRPDVTPSQVRKLTASKISGDWRGGELVGMLCVNVPGFPVPRTQARLVATAGGVEEVMALVAAGIVGEQRTIADVNMDVYLLASSAEGVDPVDALVALAESGTEDVTAAVEIERITVRMTDEEARGMPTLNASLEREVALQVDFFRDHGYWSAESLSGGGFSTEEMQNAQIAGALLVVDPLEGASIDLRDKLISRGLLV